LTSGALVKSVSLSQTTVASILDRLEKKACLKRERDQEDKRKVWVTLSDAGKIALKQVSTLLQDSFVYSFSELTGWEQSLILFSLQRVAAMMQARGFDASPVLDTPCEYLVPLLPKDG